MSLYQFLVIIHIISAIIGLGPGFIMTYIVTKASNMTELRHAYWLRKRIHLFVMIGGTSLMITGLWMGMINPYLFQQGWYVVSLILYLTVLGAGPTLLASKLKPIKKILADHKHEEIPAVYKQFAKELFFYERITNSILVVIIVLMVLKPF